MEETLQFLRRFVELSDADVRALGAYLTPVEYGAGDVIHREGKVCRDLVLLRRGLVRAYYVHDDKEVNLRLLCAPASAVALASLITTQPAGETIEAVTAVSGYRSRISDFERDHPGALVERLRRVLAEQHYLSMERRLRMLQWKSAAERYQYFLEHMESEIVEKMPGYHVASYLGVAPESLSRVRSGMRNGAA